MQQAQLELESVRSNATILQNDLEHYKETIGIKDQKITFLQGHVGN